MSDPQGTATAPGIINAEEHERNKQREFVLDFIERSNRLRQQFVDVWDEVLENYLVVPFGSGARTGMWFPPHIPDAPSRYRMDSGDDLPRLKDPETHQIIESLTGQAMGLLMGAPGYITAAPIGQDDPEKGRMIARLLMAMLEIPGVYRTHYQLFKNAFLFGTSVMEIGWQTLTRDQIIQVPKMDPVSGRVLAGPDGKPIWDVGTAEVVWKNAPLQREVLLWDFYPDPSGTRIQEDMSGVAKRFRMSKTAGLRLGNAGVYDEAKVREGLRRFESAEKSEAGKSAGVEGPFPNMAREVPSQLGSIGGFEYWGEIPWRPRGRDDSTNRVITLWADEIVRTHINPFTDGMKPFKEVVINPIAGRFYGLSPAEVVRFLQDTADNLLMLLTDAANQAVRAPLLMGNAFGGDVRRLKARKLRDIIPCANPDAVKPLEQDLNVLQLCGNILLQRKLMMREGSGATNPLQAIPTNDRKSATEASELVRMASQKVENMVQLIEREDYPWIGRILHSRLRQFAEDDGYIASLSGEMFEATLDQINVDADIRFVGSRQTSSKFQRSVQFREAFSVVNSEAILTIPEVVEQYLRDVLDFPNAKQIVLAAIQRIMGLRTLEAVGKSGGGEAQQGSAAKVPPKKGGETGGSPASEAERGGEQRA